MHSPGGTSGAVQTGSSVTDVRQRRNRTTQPRANTTLLLWRHAAGAHPPPELRREGWQPLGAVLDRVLANFNVGGVVS